MEKKLMITKQSDLDTLFKVLPEGLLLVDFDARVLRSNLVLHDLLPACDLSQKSFGDVFSCEHGGDGKCGTTDQCVHCNIRGSLKKVQETKESEYQVIFDHGFRFGDQTKTFRLKMDFIPLTLGEEDVILIIVNPVSIDLIRKMIDDKIVGDKHPFVALVKDHSRNQFLEKSIADLSHEVAHPLGDVKLGSSYISAIVENLVFAFDKNDLTKEEFSHSMFQIEETCRQLDQNVTDATEYLMAFRKLMLNDLSEEAIEIKVKDQLSTLLTSMKLMLNKNVVGVTMSIPDALIVKTQTSVFNSIFRNLIHNSISHGFVGVKSPEIHIVAESDDEFCTMLYKDNGVGIPSDIVPEIFDLKFTTGTDSNSGIGLSLVKYLIEKELGGYITLIKSETGATFRIVIPVRN